MGSISSLLELLFVCKTFIMAYPSVQELFLIKESFSLVGWEHFDYKMKKYMRFVQEISIPKTFSFCLNQIKKQWKCFWKIIKNLILSTILTLSPQNLEGGQANLALLLFSYFGRLTSCKKSERINRWFW